MGASVSIEMWRGGIPRHSPLQYKLTPALVAGILIAEYATAACFVIWRPACSDYCLYAQYSDALVGGAAADVHEDQEGL